MDPIRKAPTGRDIPAQGNAIVIPHIFLESQLGVRRQSPWARQRPGTATPLFPSAQNHTRHDAKAVSTSYTRKLASDSATALQVNSPLFFASQRAEVPVFSAVIDVRHNEGNALGWYISPRWGFSDNV